MLCLIIAPALESVINIYETARKIADNSWIKIAMAYGDSAPGLQGRFHPEKCHILVATPERLINYVSQSTIKFESLKFFILDEVNRMIDMGFMANIEEIATHQTFKTENCNTMLFAVTFTEEIHRLASIILVKYDYSTIGYNNRKFSDVDQVFFIVDKFKKRRLLAVSTLNPMSNSLPYLFLFEALLTDYIGYSEDDCILVFVEEKKTADFLASFISETKIAATSIHGDRLNHERYEALRDFRSGRFKVLFATSGVSRHLGEIEKKNV